MNLSGILSRTLAPCLLLGLLAGCRSTDRGLPEPTREILAPSAWTAQLDGDPSLPVSGWLDELNDPQLQRLVDEALAQNFSLAAAAQRLEASRQSAVIAGAGLWPQVSGSADASRTKRPVTQVTGDVDAIRVQSESYGTSLGVRWEIDLWGRLRQAREAARLEYDATSEDYRAARFSLAANVARGWYDVVAAQEQVLLSQKTVESFEKNLRLIEERFRSGLNAALDVRLLRANVASARSSLEARRRLLDQSIRSLEILLGRYPAARLDPAGEFPVLRETTATGIPSDLILRRPDLVAANQRLEASGLDLRIERKNRLPSFSLTGSVGTATDDYETWFDSDFLITRLAAGVAQPIFQGGRLKAQRKLVEARFRQALEAFAQTSLNAFREVESALAAERYLRGEEEAVRLNVEESAAAEDLSWERYQAGLTNIITVLEAQRRAFNSRNSLIDIQNRRIQNRLTLHLALGGHFARP